MSYKAKVYQGQILVRHLSPENQTRVDKRIYPVEDSEIKGFSLAPTYSLKQLREIERRRTKNKLMSQHFRMDVRGGTKEFWQ